MLKKVQKNNEGVNNPRYKDGNRKNNLSSNLEVLCPSCHIKLHRKEDRIIKECLECKKEFKALKNQRFCSPLCRDRNYRKAHKEHLLQYHREWDKKFRRRIKK